MELSDLEICKRIAEIEGENIESINKKVYDWNYNFYVTEIQLGHVKTATLQNWYNPLADDALCFQLSKKYNVCIMHGDECATARIWDDPEDNPIADFSDINNDTSLNKAILLCIIEAHKEQ